MKNSLLQYSLLLIIISPSIHTSTSYAKNTLYLKDGLYVNENRECYKAESIFDLYIDKETEDMFVETKNNSVVGFAMNSNYLKVEKIIKQEGDVFTLKIGIQPNTSSMAFKTIAESIDVIKVNSDTSFTYLDTYELGSKSDGKFKKETYKYCGDGHENQQTNIQNKTTLKEPPSTNKEKPKASGITSASDIVLTPKNKSYSTSGKFMAPGVGMQKFTILKIDTKAFTSGGKLKLIVDIGDGESEGSVDIFPENCPIPTKGRPAGTLGGIYDIPPGKKNNTLTLTFTKGGVYQLGVTGSWRSRQGATNSFNLRAVVE